ncbi:hypothetical protein BDV41DRAFT_533288, partial [Aspergillus transmontanensis]
MSNFWTGLSSHNCLKRYSSRNILSPVVTTSANAILYHAVPWHGALSGTFRRAF